MAARAELLSKANTAERGLLDEISSCTYIHQPNFDLYITPYKDKGINGLNMKLTSLFSQVVFALFP